MRCRLCKKYKDLIFRFEMYEKKEFKIYLRKKKVISKDICENCMRGILHYWNEKVGKFEEKATKEVG